MDQKWKKKIIHGRYANALHSQDIDFQLLTTYLRQKFLMPETEEFIHAIQKRVVSTRGHLAPIISSL